MDLRLKFMIYGFLIFIVVYGSVLLLVYDGGD
jgi:hypothetical protein